jgi:hypothetical protein
MIKYKKRRKYKYNLHGHAQAMTGVKPFEAGDFGLLAIEEDGLLTIKPGYSWDGPSGPTFDTKNFMRGSLFHDALYQLMREQKVGQDQRKRADELLREHCIEDGMSKVRAWWVYRGVRIGSKKYALPDLQTAP